jgi:deoxyribonuclease V
MRDDAEMWPSDIDDLAREQRRLAAADPLPWRLPEGSVTIGGCWVAFARGLAGRGSIGDPAWCAAVTMRGRRTRGAATLEGQASWSYAPGLLALRLGALFEAVVDALPERPDVLLVDATGRDHPRRAGLALHLGAVLDVPTVGVTHRPLLASGHWPVEGQPTSPIRLDDEVVGHWVQTRPGTRPVVVHAGWRTDPMTAVDVVWRASAGHRTPEPLRQARRLARRSRAADSRSR